MFRGISSRGMRADLEREVLGVDAERVEAERLEDRVPLQPLESSIDVVAREREEVADVQPLRRRIREHHQGVERPRAGGEVGVVRARALPSAPAISARWRQDRSRPARWPNPEWIASFSHLRGETVRCRSEARDAVHEMSDSFIAM